MRLALYGMAASDAPDGATGGRAPAVCVELRTAVESMGAVLAPIPLAAVARRLRCDAMLVAPAGWDGARDGAGGGAEGRSGGADRDAGTVAGYPGPELRAIVAFARAGGPVLAIGAGVGSLCALGLLPGRIASRAGVGVGAAAPSQYLRVQGRPTPFTSAIPAGRVLRLPAQAEPRFEWQLADAAALEARGQVIFRSCDAAGGTRAHDAIAGVSNEAGNVVGLFTAPQMVGGEGAQLLRSLHLHLRAGHRERGRRV